MEQNSQGIDAASSTKNIALLDAFLAVVAAGSFTMAARRTHTDKSQLSRRVRSLEESLGVRLLHRTTRKIHVTEAGQALYARVSGPMEQLAAALTEAAQGDRLEGRVRIATIPHFAREVLLPVVSALRDEHPDVRVELHATEDIVDLVGEGYDLALRTGNLPDSNLVARRLAQWSYLLVATPQWVQQHQPEHPQDLVDHWLLYGDVPRADQWELRHGDEQVELRVGSVMTSDNSWVLTEAVRAGMGVTAMPPFVAAEYVERGELVRVLPQWRVGGRHVVYVVYPHRGLLPLRVQAVIERLAGRLAGVQARWDGVSAG
ncbi:MAG: LysR family transcriptional regulator [Nannocystaceae bacterium]